MTYRLTHQRVGQIRGRRGIVLVFVVVLLVLLAIMGTAYLSVTRLDRQTISSRGSLLGQTTPRLGDTALLNQLHASAERAAKNELIRDLFNVGKVDVRLSSTLLNQPLSSTNSRTVDGFSAMQGGIDSIAKIDAPNPWSRFRQQMGVNDRPISDTGTHYVQTYENYDAPGRADPFLASLLPERRNPEDPTRPQQNDPVLWPWISGVLNDSFGFASRPEPFFSDPRYLGSRGFTRTYGVAPATATLAAGNDVLERRDVLLNDYQNAPTFDGTVKLGRKASIPSADNTRVYPAFRIPNQGTQPFIAADADGDGIADAGMMPIAINTNATGTARYVDSRNGVIYFVGYRVVDNSAQLNVNTALSVTGDFSQMFVRQANIVNPTAATIEARTLLRANRPDSPNYGFFRSNIGLLELVKDTLHLSNNSGDLYGDSPNATGTNTSAMYRETASLIDTRLPILAETPGQDTDVISRYLRDSVSDPVGAFVATGARNGVGGIGAAFEFRTIGDLLENQVLHRSTGSVGKLAWNPNATAAVSVKQNGVSSFAAADAVALAFKGGTLMSPTANVTSVENALLLSSRLSAPNFTANGNTPWQWFPPGEVNIWFEWTKDFDLNISNNALAVYDSAPGAQARYFDFTANSFVGPGSGLADMRSPRSIRSLLTARNGATALVPMRGTVEELSQGSAFLPVQRMFVPIGMPSYEEFAGARTYLPMPAVKASAATSPKEELWRAYWSAMTTSSPLITLGSGASTTPDPAATGYTVTKRSYPLAERNVPATTPPTNGIASFNYDNVDAATPGTGTKTRVYEAFRSPDRHASEPLLPGKSTDAEPYSGGASQYNRLNEQQMALLRSAIAACNTIDLRDADNDITAMTVDLGPTQAGSATPRMMARVYGNEKQLVITGVTYDTGDARVGAPVDPLAPETVVVEIFNPTDQTLSLEGYVIASTARPAGPGTTLADPAAEIANTLPAVPLNTGAAVPPGGYLLLVSSSEGYARSKGLIVDTTSAPYNNTALYQVLDSAAAPGLSALLAEALQPNHELGLFRTRRADGQPYSETLRVQDVTGTDPKEYHRPAFSETLADPKTLVPMDVIDSRGLALTEGTYTLATAADKIALRYHYMRQTNDWDDANPKDQAWRCFYAGRFFQIRSDDEIAPDDMTAVRTPAPTNPTLHPVRDYPWYRFTSPPSPTSLDIPAPALTPKMGEKHSGVATGANGSGSPLPAAPEPIRAPAIRLQNFTPDAGRHPQTQFPYASPFARDGDLLSVPFIGSYKLYRVDFTGNANDPATRTVGTSTLYEFVPITMDAVNVAPNPAYCVNDPSVGRFDPTPVVAANHLYTNEWAKDLFDFVTARQSPSHNRFPDMPLVKIQNLANPTAAVNINDPTDYLTDQDGPVQGLEAATAQNTTATPWVAWRNLNTGVATSASRAGDDLEGKSTLIQGKLNPNTAPPVNMRLLPLVVDASNGLVNIKAPAQLTKVGDINKRLYDVTNQQGLQVNDSNLPPFGIESVFDLGNVVPTTASAAQLLDLGMLNNTYRVQTVLDPIATKLDSIRLSNLVSPRSDVFTVYVTVQAWTYVGDTAGGNQVTDTRLVGEKRSAFIVDRSAITGDKFQPSDLIVLPVDED